MPILILFLLDPNKQNDQIITVLMQLIQIKIINHFIHMAEKVAQIAQAPAQQELPAYSTAPESGFTRNNRIFAYTLFGLQLFLIVMYAVFIRPTAHISRIYGASLDGLDNGLVTAVGAATLVLIGFGLYFSYLKNMLWSGLGFTFLITVIVFQYYFVINGFWSKASLQMSSNNGWSNTYIQTYLSNQNADTSNGGIDPLGATAVSAFKCALSMSIAFAAIGGRGGPLEALIIIIVGVITFELNRQIISLFSVDVGGSMTVFEFGGFYGTTIAVLLRLYSSQQTGLQYHTEYQSQKFNVTLSLIGAAFCWVFFPTINMDIPTSLFIYSNGGISTIYCISATVVTAIGFSLLLNGKLLFRDVITAPIAGGVIIGSSSIYIYNPLQSLMFGVFAGILQVLFNRVEKKTGSHPFWSNGVLFLFGVQGFLGGLFSSVMRAINKTSGTFASSYSGLISKYVFDQRGQISAVFITLGISIITGIVVFLLIKLVNQEQKEDYYHDKTYWIMDDDGISRSKHVEIREDSEFIYSDGADIKGEQAYL